MRRLYLELKNQRYYFFVPPFILFVLLPLAVLATIKNGVGGNFAECATIAQLFITSFAAWWPLFILKDYLNSPGKELLYVYKFGRKSLLLTMMILWMFFVLQVMLLFVYLTSLFEFVWFLFIAVIIQSLFMIALGYFFSLLLQNTFIPLIINFTYSSIFMLALIYSPLSIFQIGSFNDAESLNKSIVVAIIAAVLFYGGYQIEKRLYKDSI